MTTTDAVALAALAEATIDRPPDVRVAPARFAAELRPRQDEVAVLEEMRAALTPLGARVEPLSELEPRVILVELPGRLFGAEPAAAFTAAEALRTQFRLRTAEPDLPTAFFPEAEPPAEGEVPFLEGGGGFPPGCWEKEDRSLDRIPMWALERLRVPEAWAFSEARHRPHRGRGIVVAQPDTGVTVHPELAGVAVVPGFDVLDDDTDPTDPLGDGNPGHGTGTASVLISPEGRVVTGSAPAAQHMPIRAIESVVRVTQVSVARSIDWAVAHGAHVITMSLGGIPAFTLHRALRRAVAADVVVLAAAGNCVRTVVWPARYEDCIAIGGTNERDRPWKGSCRGPAVDVSAPAENVLRARTSTDGRPTGQGQGTSFAVALTAGVAALWLAHHGRANLVAEAHARGETLQAMFRRLVRATARRPAGWDVFDFGAGIVDAEALLRAPLDLGSGEETVLPPVDPRAGAAASVQSLVAEVVDPEAVDPGVDWVRFGPEIAATLLADRFAALGDGDLDREAGVGAPAVSAHLTLTVRNPRLRQALGLESAPEATP